MVDIISANADGDLHISHSFEGKPYSFSLTSGAAPEFSRKTKQTMDAVIDFIEKNPQKVAEDVKLRDALKAASGQFEALGMKPEKVTQLKDALSFVKAGTVEETTAALVRNPLARKLMIDKELTKAGIEDVSKLDKLIAAKEKLLGYAKDVKANKAGIRATLIEHLDAPDAVKDALFGKHKAKFAGILKDLGAEFIDVSKKIGAALDEIKALDTQIDAVERAGGKTKGLLAAREKQVQKMVKATTGKDFAGKLLEGMKESNPKIFDELMDVDAKLTSHFESTIKNGASAAAKTGENKWYSIFKGENALAEVAKKEGVAVEKLGFLKKIRPGKAAAIAGIAAVGTYFVAGMGNRGPSERAESVNRSREGQAAGLGA